MKKTIALLTGIFTTVLFPTALRAYEHLQTGHHYEYTGINYTHFATILEVPVILFVLFLAFGVLFSLHKKLRSSFFLLAGGIILMGLGHLLLIWNGLFEIWIPSTFFGETLGSFIWLGVLLLSWILMAMGIWRLRLLNDLINNNNNPLV